MDHSFNTKSSLRYCGHRIDLHASVPVGLVTNNNIAKKFTLPQIIFAKSRLVTNNNIPKNVNLPQIIFAKSSFR